MNDIHISVTEPDAGTLERLRERMYAFCFPNVPRTLEEQAAFEEAVRMQHAHEETAKAAREGIPEGVQGFRIGDFQMSFADGGENGPLNGRTICPGAYGLLLRNGLLYRGAEGRSL